MNRTLDSMLDDIKNPFRIIGPQSISDWKILIERRAKIVLTLANDFSLPLLPDMPWILRDNRTKHYIPLRHTRLPVTPDTYNIPGVFGCAPHNGENIWLGETSNVSWWGLSKKGLWLQGIIRYQKQRTGELEDMWGMRVMDFTYIKLDDMDPLLPDHHQHIWHRLGETVFDWYVSTEKRFKQIKAVNQLMNVEGTMLAHSLADEH